jgi:hypothetical protein
MKTILLQTAAVLALSTFPALAGPFGLPDHEPNGWRDTGCDEAFNVEIKNDEGKVLYLNNPTCPMPEGSDPAEVSAPGDGDGEGPGDGDGEGPGDGDGEGPGDGDGDNGHGNDDDGDDDSNPGQGGGKPGKPGNGKPIKLA